MVGNFFRLVILTSACAFAVNAYGAPATFIYQGQIIKANGIPLSGNPTTFTVQIISPGTEACVLYQEKHILNMAGSEGVFSLSVGNGTRAGSGYEDASNVVNIFKNNGAFSGLTTCAGGGSSYAPASLNERRKLRLTFNDGSGDVVVASDHNVQSVPFAWDAKTIDGLAPANFVQINTFDNVTQAKLEAMFTGTNYSTLLGVATGSTQFVAVGTNGAAMPKLTTDPVSPVAGSMWLNTTTNEMKYHNGSGVQVIGAGGGGGGGTLTGVTTTAPLAGGGTSGSVALTIGYDNTSVGVNGSSQLEVKANGITSAHIGAGVILDSDLAANSVTTAKILNANVTDAKIDTVGVQKIISAMGQYLTYQPNGAACVDGEVLKWNTLTGWECGADNDTNTNAVASVFGRTGVVTATAGDYSATQIVNAPAGNVAAVTAQGAINELDNEKVSNAGDSMSGDLTMNAQKEVRFSDSDSSNYGSIRAPTTIATNYVLTLPDTDGNAGEVLTTDGSGVLSWSPASAGDIVGVTTNSGSALTGGATSGTPVLQVIVDNSTIEIATNALQIKASGVGTAQIADDAVTTVKILDANITDAKIADVSVDKITSSSGKYFKYMPNAAECTSGGVLKWNSTDDQWECGTDSDTNTDAVASVFGRTGVIAATAGDYTAAQITNTPAGAIAAITTQAAIDELDSEKLALVGGTLTGAVTTTSSLMFNAQNEARYGDADSSNYAAIRAPATIATNYVLTLPDTDGNSGEVLTTDGAGVLIWSPAAAGDILGVTTNSGSGLSGGAASGTPVLQVVVDNSTVEIATNTIQLKDAGVTNAKIISMTVDKLTSAASKYLSYMPNAVECADDGILKWDATNDQWICGIQSVGTGDITSVVAGTGLTGGATTGDATLNVNIGTAMGQLFTIDAVPHCAPNQKIEITSGPIYTFSCENEYVSSSLADADGDTKIQVEETANEDKIRFDTAGSERMIITETGNVGIGITPTQKLHVNGLIETDGGMLFNQGPGGADNLIYLGSATSGSVNASLGFFAAGVGSQDAAAGAYFLARGNDFNALSNQRGNMYFVAGGPTTPDDLEGSFNFMTGTPETLRMKITRYGSVGLGTDSPAASLDIGSKNDAIVLPKGTTAEQPPAVAGMLRYNTTTSSLEYYNTAWRTVSAGGAGSYLSSTGGTLSGLLTISSGGANITGGVDNNSGGITEAGSITGVGSNITGAGAMTVAAGGANQNLTLNASGTGATSIGNGGGTQFQILNNGASTVNYVTVKGATAGNAPVIGTGGSDTNINLNFTPKGTGNSIFTSGNVGIGPMAPLAKLHVSGPAAGVRMESTTDANFALSLQNSAANRSWQMYQLASTDSNAPNGLQFEFYNGSVFSQAMTINQSGNVGIGTVSPAEKLTVNGRVLVRAPSATPLSSVFPGALVVQGSGVEDSLIARTDPATTNAAAGVFHQSSTTPGFDAVRVQSVASSATQAILNVVSGVSDTTGVGGTSRLFVRGDGNVGIGTASPVAPLQVGPGTSASAVSDGAGVAFSPQILSSQTSGVAGVGVGINDGTNNRRAALFVDQPNGVWGLSGTYTTGATDFVLRVANVERMRVTSTGEVGIGTTNPQAKLEVAGGAVIGTGFGAKTIGVVSYFTGTNSTAYYIHIKTPFKPSIHSNMYHFRVEGFAYGDSRDVDIVFTGYAYSGNPTMITSPTARDPSGAYAPTQYVGSNGFIYLRFKPTNIYYLSFRVDSMYVGNGRIVYPGEMTVTESTAATL